MKIVLVCNGGMSTSILMQNIEDYAKGNNLDIQADAYGLSEYEEHLDGADILLLGPQIAYKKKSIEGTVNVPVMVVQAFDYATGNVKNILNQIKKIKGE